MTRLADNKSRKTKREIICSVGFEFNSLHIYLIDIQNVSCWKRIIARTKLISSSKVTTFEESPDAQTWIRRARQLAQFCFLSILPFSPSCHCVCSLIVAHLKLYINFLFFHSCIFFFLPGEICMTYHIFYRWFDSFKTVRWSRRKKSWSYVFPLSFKDWRQERRPRGTGKGVPLLHPLDKNRLTSLQEQILLGRSEHQSGWTVRLCRRARSTALHSLCSIAAHETARDCQS